MCVFSGKELRRLESDVVEETEASAVAVELLSL